MTSSAIEALYFINSQSNEHILNHVYRGRPASSRTLLPLYLAQQKPRPNVLHIPNVNPATTLFSVSYTNLYIFAPASRETEPLFVLEFLHRLIDVLEEFLGAPVLASKIEANYDVVAQLLAEMCDAGNVITTEPNALREVVNTPGFIDNLLGGLGLPGSTPSLSSSNPLQQQLARRPQNTGPAIPWRKSNVRHTSNELYVDMVETIQVTLAPSGRPLAAFANGSILFTAKISGVPDLVLNITTPSGKHALEKVMELPTFHPCVRLARWKERPGEFSFVPPDGKFLLAGYEVNLLPDSDFKSATTKSLNLPVTIEMNTSLGATGLEFEARLILNPPGSESVPNKGGFGGGLSTGARGSGRSTPSFFSSGASSSAPQLRDVVVSIPMPEAVRNMNDLRASRGEASFNHTESAVEWRLPTKDVTESGTATLRCTVVGPLGEETVDTSHTFDAANGEYDEAADAEGYQGSGSDKEKEKEKEVEKSQAERDSEKVLKNKILMPTSAAVSFSVKGWLASGLKVESLNVDTRKSRGLGDGVKPVKGAKYLTVSKKGIETRC